MPIRLYNTATRRKEDFAPQNPPQVTMYNCGPTVYDYFHVGNARNFVVVDAIRRHLEHRGYKVRFAQNFTDIDDKIIKRSNERGEAWDALAKRFTEAYFKNADSLGVRRADIHPCATDHIPQMIAMIERLIERGLAYPVEGGDVYYRVRAFNEYGALSGKDINDLEEGARVEVGDAKEDPLDFALWKGAKPGEPSWDCPWGKGRPGWHIECSAMSTHHLGETIDIHSGGVDLIFPHHENERAQSVGATGKPFVRYWLHNGFLTIDNEKMAKSAGNFFTIDQVLEKYPAAVVRFFLLSAHYRSPLDYSPEALDQAKAAVARIREAITTAEKIVGTQGAASAASPESPPASPVISTANATFDDSMDDDFNTQRAIGAIFELVAALNEARQAFSKTAGSPAQVHELLAAIHTLLARLGLDELMYGTTAETAGENRQSAADTALTGHLLDLLVRTRTSAKAAKQYQLADQIRDELATLGVRLQDHPTGTIWIRD